MEARRDVFQAIADPTRREIISMLATRSLNLNAVAEHFEISRPAISKQMKILRECGLVTIRREGREHYCDAKLDSLRQVTDWVERYRKVWNERFDSLGSYLEELQTKSPEK